jgi:hypothetical protein
MTTTALKTETSVAEDQRWLASRHATDSAIGVPLYIPLFTPSTYYPDGILRSGIGISYLSSGPGDGSYGPYLGHTSEQQTITITGTPTGGTWTATFDGQTTAAIAYNATAAAVQLAVEALSNVTPGEVTVTGGPGPGTPWVVTFTGDKAGQNVPQITTSSSLTGGSSPTITVTTTTAGGTAETNGQSTLTGFILDTDKVPAGVTTLTVPMLWHGAIKRSWLPIQLPDPSGWGDVAGRIWPVPES